jgi:hypothetical protein
MKSNRWPDSFVGHYAEQKIHIAPFSKSGAFTAWCRACKTVAYVHDSDCVQTFRDQHAKCGDGR